ncbi:MAG: amino transporter, permease, region, His/Glu/Gln/Arg/opine family domain protein [Rhodospirillales bacterium]|nr:amino transporter, permease, region, His/Glu/Gln/Arg/opine family domain protein [Rhodospirillales bacterium]MDB5381958.1 amino transporter, permease, region, His/Glu/Gln/Arg/opine family domain protein [Rhodospirillales bacterium]
MNFQFQFEPVFAQADVLLDGLLLTLELAGAGIVLGGLLGTLLALLRRLVPGLRLVIGAYVEIVRNTPFLIQLFIVYLGLPQIGIRLTPEQAAVITMTLNLGAYTTEIVRAGLDSVHPSQIEAGLSLALSRWQVLRHVVLAPALARVWPSLSSQFVLMLLSSSIFSFISVQELSGAASNVEQDTFKSFETYIVVTAVYLGLAMGLRLILMGLGAVLFPAGSGLGRLRQAAGNR